MVQRYRFHYQLIGSTTKPVVLFLHGFMGNSACFSDVIALLSDELCCLAIDLPGHGSTAVIGDDDCYTMSHAAQGVVDLLDQLHIKTCHLVGYSMGGRVALYLLIHFQQRILNAVLESTSPGLKTRHEQLQRLQHDKQLAERLKTTDFSTFLSDWYNHPLFQSTQVHPDFLHLFQRRLHNNPAALAKSLYYMGTGNQPSLWERLQHNRVPILLIVGDRDPKFKAINAEMAALCPTAQLKIIDRCGHNVHFENREAFVYAIKPFILSMVKNPTFKAAQCAAAPRIEPL